MSDRLGIERSLKQAEQRVGQPLYEKYRVLKDRLFSQEYAHWATAFPGGNDHGPGHIERVLEKLDQLIDGNGPGKNLLRPYELFLSMMSVLYHDIGLLRGRTGHADASSVLLQKEHNDYLLDPSDREIVSAAVVSHSSNKDINAETSRFANEEMIGGQIVRPRLIAALVRLADELDEDFRRADPILQGRLQLPEDSNFFWEFCQRVKGIRPDLNSHIINIDISFLDEDAGRSVLINGRRRPFVSAFSDKLAKINSERVLVNAFLPDALRYNYLKLSVKPLAGHAAWKHPRDFIFGEYTGGIDFVSAFPELLLEPANDWLNRAVKYMREGSLEKAVHVFEQLGEISHELPWRTQFRYFYESACLYSLKAGLVEAPSGRDELLETSLINLRQCIRILLDETWRADGENPYNSVFRMSRDSDLYCLLQFHRAEILRQLPPEMQSAVSQDLPKQLPGKSFGCFPAHTPVSTPTGEVMIEDIEEGDQVVSIDFSGSPPCRIVAQVIQVHTLREPRCVVINGRHVLTPSQPVYLSEGEFVAAGELAPDMSIMTSGLEPEVIRGVSVIDGYFEVYTLTTDHPSHNYLAGGIVCQNGVKWG